MIAQLGVLAMDLMGYRPGARALALDGAKLLGAVAFIGVIYRLSLGCVRRCVRRWLDQRTEAPAEDERRVRARLEQLAGFVVAAIAVILLASLWDLTTLIRSAASSIQVLTWPGEDGGTALTLWDLCSAGLLIGAGHLISSRLDALLDVLLFRHFGELERGIRFVVETICRYALLVLVYSLALFRLGIDLSSLGWVLAGASVGLGFGLQEVFANFVSGLILLLERPIRVGDLISVGETEGTVERIDIRATQVVNLDGQLLYIPNKQFVTSQLINWTRNHGRVRMNVQLELDREVDAASALDAIRGALEHEELVLDFPPPQVILQGARDGALLINIWFFCEVSERFAALSSANLAIRAALAEAGISLGSPRYRVALSPAPGDPLDGDAQQASLPRDRPEDDR